MPLDIWTSGCKGRLNRDILVRHLVYLPIPSWPISAAWLHCVFQVLEKSRLSARVLSHLCMELPLREFSLDYPLEMEGVLVLPGFKYPGISSTFFEKYSSISLQLDQRLL